MANCGCNTGDIEYSKTPPYVSKKALEDYLAGRCTSCNEAVAFQVEPTFPECCDDQIVTRGGYELLRVDDASNTSYVGVGGAIATITHTSTGTPTLTANAIYIIPFTTSGTNTEVTDDIGVTFGSDAIILSRAGFYAVDVTIETSNNTAARQTNWYINKNGTSETYKTTWYNSGANPTESTNRRIARINWNDYMTVGQSWVIYGVSGLTISTALKVNVRIVRLSVTR